MILIPVSTETAQLVKTLNNGVDVWVDDTDSTVFVVNGPGGYTGIVSAETAKQFHGYRTTIYVEHIDEDRY